MEGTTARDLLDDLDARLARLARFEPLEAQLPEGLAAAGIAVRSARAEILRFGERGAKLLVAATLSAAPDLDAAAWRARGFALERGAHSVTLARASESILIIPEGEHALVEWSRECGPIAPGEAARSLSQVPALAVFAPLAQGAAVLKSWGLARDAGGAVRGLVAVHRDLERLDEDEAALRAAGFSEGSEEGLWSTPGETHSIAWMGGTVYGYVGPVPPDEIGGW